MLRSIPNVSMMEIAESITKDFSVDEWKDFNKFQSEIMKLSIEGKVDFRRICYELEEVEQVAYQNWLLCSYLWINEYTDFVNPRISEITGRPVYDSSYWNFETGYGGRRNYVDLKYRYRQDFMIFEGVDFYEDVVEGHCDHCNEKIDSFPMATVGGDWASTCKICGWHSEDDHDSKLNLNPTKDEIVSIKKDLDEIWDDLHQLVHVEGLIWRIKQGQRLDEVLDKVIKLSQSMVIVTEEGE